MTRQRLPKLKISWRRGKQYTSPVTLGGDINKHHTSPNLIATLQRSVSHLTVVRK